MLEFKNYKDLMSKLSDEKVCREAMEQWRWNGSPFCPHCNGTKPYKLKDGKTYWIFLPKVSHPSGQSEPPQNFVLEARIWV